MTARRLACAVVALVLLLGAVPAGAARTWSWLGVRIRDLSEQEMEDISAKHGLREGFGVMVVQVLEGTPAAKAGMQTGDIVVAFEGRPVTETRLLQRLIAAAPAERDVSLTVLRPDGRRELPVRLATMPPPLAGERVAEEIGFVLGDAEAPAEPGGRAPSSAPLVTFVGRGSAAERAGLELGDVVLQVGERAVVTRDAAREALADLEPGRPVHLVVRRGERHVSLDVPVP